MRKSLKILIAKAEEVVKAWEEIEPKVQDERIGEASVRMAVQELKESIKKVKGEA